MHDLFTCTMLAVHVYGNDTAILCRFRILNTRLPFKFIFVTNIINWSNGSFSVLASTPAISVANPNSPTQIRLALTNITG